MSRTDGASRRSWSQASPGADEPLPRPDHTHDAFWQAALDALPDSVAVLDGEGLVVAVNRSWRTFGRDNGATGDTVGSDYLAVCDRAALHDPAAAEVSAALRAVLAGGVGPFACTYPCHSPSEDRWFAVRISPFDQGGQHWAIVQHHDITAGHQAIRRGAEQTEMLDAVDAAIVATDLDGVLTHWSTGAAGLFGWTASEVVGHHLDRACVLPLDFGPVAALLDHLRRHGSWEGHADVRRRDGSTFPAYVRNRLVRDAAGEPVGFSAVVVDMTESAAMERELRAAHDFLGAVTQTMPDGLCVIDERGVITLINEAAEAMLGWGRDELLGEVMHRRVHGMEVLRGLLESPDHQALPGDTPRADDEFLRRDGSRVPVSWSAKSFTTATDRRGLVVVFADITERRRREERVRRELEALSWVGRIRDALERDRFVLYAQPIVELASGEVVQHELLVRMLDDDGGLVPPGSFLPVAEEHGLIRAIDRHVFEKAFAIAARGHPVHVNVSADSLGDLGLFRFVEQRMALHGVRPEHVVFEITETALIHNEAAAQALVEKLVALGCTVALDDFGTGYGSFRYLKRLPVGLLKIDQEFVRDLKGSDAAANRHVIQAVVSLARGMGQRTVAEGVEDPEALAVLAELGVDLVQGYFLGRPAPAGDVFPTT